MNLDIPDVTDSVLRQPQKILPQFTTAILESYIPFLQMSLHTASQMVSNSGVILSRSYSTYKPESISSSFIEEINLGYYSPRYRDSVYYVVSFNYDVERMRSNNMWVDPTDPSYFRKWLQSTDTYRAALHFLNKVVASYTWQRPRVLSSGSDSGSPFYIPLPDPTLIITANAGSAVKATISSTYPIIAYLVDSEGVEHPVSNSSSFLMVHPILHVYVTGNPPPTIPIEVTVTFIGEYAFTSLSPVGYTEPLTLVHPASESNVYLPPGQSNLPTNFWNTNPPTIQIDYSTRTGASSTFEGITTTSVDPG